MAWHVQDGKRYRHRSIEMWASGGLIYCEDQNDGECVVNTIDEFKEYMRQIGNSYKRQIDKWSVNDRFFVELRNEYAQLLDSFHNLILEATAQGDPGQAFVQAEKQESEARTMRAQLMAYDRSPEAAIVHKEGSDLTTFNPMLDPRARRTPHGTLWLPHGGGAKTERKHF